MCDAGVLRILDANANRAREGLRVAEEYTRFVLDSQALTEQLKQLRHDLNTALFLLQNHAPEAPEDWAGHRDTAGDVGTRVSTESEQHRPNRRAVARANLKRVQEALRALEEYGKLLDPQAASRLEQLRYAVYRIEPLLAADAGRRQQLQAARLYVLVTGSLASTDALTAAREAVAGGADVIQMREKELEDKAFHEQALAMREICHAGGSLFLVNDRPHIAVLAEADGIHTGQGDLPVHLARRLLGPDRLVGRSTCCPEQLQAAFAAGADYVGVGPVYATQTKQHRAAAGLGYAEHAVRNARLPFFCIGSVNRETLDSVLATGARAVAVCTAIIGARDIAAEAAWFRSRLTEN